MARNRNQFGNEFANSTRRPRRPRLPGLAAMGGGAVFLALIALVAFAYLAYNFCRIDVPAKHIAVLTKKTGTDLMNDQEVARSTDQKGLQTIVLNEGRYFKNPYHWDWAVYPMIEIPENKLGVRIRLYGKDLPYGNFVAPDDDHKGIVQQELRPGRYAINALLIDEDGNDFNNRRRKSDYVEIIQLHDPVTIPAGYKGVVTNLSGPIPDNPNRFLVEKGSRGVQKETLNEGTHYLNPYMYRVQPIDCRSQRFNLAEGDDMGFPSKDGFWVSLDGIVEFRVKPEEAALVYVMYDDAKFGGESDGIDKEIIRKVIMPNARSFCRIQGSNSSGRDFIDGETRSAFQEAFQEAIRNTCSEQGIEIVQALITKINPPQAIASPVRNREVAFQKLKQYQQEKLQYLEEAKLAKEIALVTQAQELVESDREVVILTIDAMKRQEVAIAEANRDKEVAEEELAASKDEAAAILAESRAEAAVIRFANQADAAGWKKSVEAFGGDGDAFARYVLYQKMAPGFKSIMTNTADSPLMKIFENFAQSKEK